VTASATLDRVADRVQGAVTDANSAMKHFGDGDLHKAALKLRAARDELTRSLTIVNRRGH
jgi:hypothetical protein